jgi:hypothetical protein
MSRQPVDGPKRQSRHRYQLTIPDGGGPLYVVLVWTDLAERDLQNTLQLDVRGPGGLGLVGNHDHRWKKDGDLPIALDTPAPVPFDRINNVQMVFIEKPPAGDYTVIIHADNTTHPGIAQGYAICARGTLDSELVPLDA